MKADVLGRFSFFSALVSTAIPTVDTSRLMLAGVGIITASAIVATIGNPGQFKSARHFAAFLGLTPKEHSTGGRHRLGRISKQGDAYIRRLLVLGGTSLLGGRLFKFGATFDF